MGDTQRTTITIKLCIDLCVDKNLQQAFADDDSRSDNIQSACTTQNYIHLLSATIKLCIDLCVNKSLQVFADDASRSDNIQIACRNSYVQRKIIFIFLVDCPSPIIYVKHMRFHYERVSLDCITSWTGRLYGIRLQNKYKCQHLFYNLGKISKQTHVNATFMNAYIHHVCNDHNKKYG